MHIEGPSELLEEAEEGETGKSIFILIGGIALFALGMVVFVCAVAFGAYYLIG